MLDWDDLRFFLAIVREGNLSGAAKVLRVAQSTVGRRLASLEGGLGVRLLNRTPDGYVATAAGQDVMVRAERLEAEALALERSVGGRDLRLAGLVRVTCAETVATHILAPCLATLHRLHPDIAVELIPNPRELSLSMREADISVRLTPSEQHDLIVRRVGSIAFGLYASAGYLAVAGAPDLQAGCPGQFLITQLEDIQDATQTGWLADLAPQARVALETTSHEAAVAACLHGGGLACLARFRADAEPALILLDPPSRVPSAGIWIVLHRDNRAVPRVRAVLTHIADHLQGLAETVEPVDAPTDPASNLAVSPARGEPTCIPFTVQTRIVAHGTCARPAAVRCSKLGPLQAGPPCRPKDPRVATRPPQRIY